MFVSYLFIGCVSRCCCAGFCLAAVSRGCCLAAVHRLLTRVASPVEEHGLCVGGLQYLASRELRFVVPRLQSTDLEVVAHGLSCSEACGIFLDQGPTLSHALAGRFFTTEPPGKASHLLLCSIMHVAD